MNWQSLLRENRWQKLFALGLAVLIWFTVSSTQRLGLMDDAADGMRTFTQVPILLLSTATNIGHYQVTPATARVDLRGNPQKLRDVSLALIQVYVQLSDDTIPSQTLGVRVNPPPGTTVAKLEPNVVLVDRLPELPP